MRSKAPSIALVVGVAAWLSCHRGADVDPAARSPEAAVAGVLAARGLACDDGDILWIDRPAGGTFATHARALVRAHVGADPSDLYVVDARVSPEGSVLQVGDAWNVTETTSVDESRPLLRDKIAAYATSADGLIMAVHTIDFAGRPPDADFTRVQRWQVALTNLQQTGQAAGIVHSAFVFDPVGRSVALALRADGALEARVDDHMVVIDAAGANVIDGAKFVRVVADERSRPGNVVTWAVDRVRAMPWVGDDRMQWVKAVAFTALDKLRATFGSATTAEDVREELGIEGPPPASYADPDVGWPPPPMKPIATNPLPGEGQWISLERDPFITPAPSGSASAFVTSFIRPDPQRPDVRVYATLWDPRQIELHMEAGTVEPISATGEHGPGLIPRTPETLKRVAAAFNGGFQALHGEYGMAANGIEYLPPKPYAATIAELRDGSIGFGAWPDSPNVPDDVVAFRQNLTALVQGGKFNPWGRTWWGGAPPGWPDQIHSTRSAICLTDEGFVGYFYSPSIAPDDLARGMLAARCAFGVHLDMNPGHAGFEFYDVSPRGPLPALGRPLQSDWEAEGKVPDMPGYTFRARRMIRAMGHMLFPRYIQREARDFFYLAWRPTLPGPAVPDSDGAWRTKGLPQHGFPPAIALTSAPLRAAQPEVRLRVLRADPRTMRLSEGSTQDAPAVLALVASLQGELTLWWSGGLFAIAQAPPGHEATSVAAGYPPSDPRAADARSVVGVQDEDGMLAWVELPPDATADASTVGAMDGLLQKLGCSARIALLGARALPGGNADAAGDPVAHPPPATARFIRGQSPNAHAIFPDTPIVPIRVWQPLQAKRIRYFLPPPSASTAPLAHGSPSSTPTPPPPPEPAPRARR
ncbi:MAG TPA: hypothetical protein VKU41_16010 [Polyangiaceae bacterium]|nr:hypothetical protein [Polyangiaceae bacterium]